MFKAALTGSHAAASRWRSRQTARKERRTAGADELTIKPMQPFSPRAGKTEPFDAPGGLKPPGRRGASRIVAGTAIFAAGVFIVYVHRPEGGMADVLIPPSIIVLGVSLIVNGLLARIRQALELQGRPAQSKNK